MASDPKEPEKYSLDEMMQRLRSRGGGSEPELVTRPDGTQVYKVRKRKRRTHQPHKIRQQRLQKIRMMQIGALVVLLMLLVTGAVGMFAYYNSSGFVDKLRAQISTWTGAEIEFGQFRVTPVRASALTANMRWPEGHMLREAKLTGVSANLKITSFLSSKWTGEEVVADEAILVLGAPRPGPDSDSSAPSPGEASFPFSFTRYRCKNMNVYFGEPGKAGLKCRNMETSFYRLPEADQLRINKGTISIAGWPKLPLERGLIEFDQGMMTISSLRLGTGSHHEGSADIKGVIDPRSAKPAVLDVTLEKFPFELIGGKKLAHIVDMPIDSQAKLSFTPGDFGSHELVAPFDEGSSSKGVFIGGFPFLSILDQEFQDEGFGIRSFTSEATGVLRRNAQGLALENLNLKEKNFLALTGELKISRTGKIAGYFDVGVAQRLAGRHPSPLFRAVFDREEFGFRWTRIELSGTVQKPKDTFAQNVKKAAEAADKTPEKAKTDSAANPSSNEELETKFRDLIDHSAPGSGN